MKAALTFGRSEDLDARAAADRGGGALDEASGARSPIARPIWRTSDAERLRNSARVRRG